MHACTLNLFDLYLEAEYHLALAESFKGYGKNLLLGSKSRYSIRKRLLNNGHYPSLQKLNFFFFFKIRVSYWDDAELEL